MNKMDKHQLARIISFSLLIIGIIITSIGLFQYYNSGKSTNFSGSTGSWMLIIFGILTVIVSGFIMGI